MGEAHELAALASDTWGCEVRPNETEPGINQPWHWITIPIMGMTMGEIFQVKDWPDDCAPTACTNFLFVAPPIPITGAVGLAGQSAGDQVGYHHSCHPGQAARPRSGTHLSALSDAWVRLLASLGRA
jgi:hypothetical protein